MARLISRYELKHALRDLRHRDGWHDYFYTATGDLLRPIELWLRRRACSKHGHRWAPIWSWKTGCSRCGKPDPVRTAVEDFWAKQNRLLDSTALIDNAIATLLDDEQSR